MANRSSASDRWLRGGMLVAGCLLAGSLVWRLASSPTGDAVASLTSGVLDVAVGLTFVVAGAFPSGATLERLWIGATGVAWMTATWLPSLSGVHQGLLILAVVLFASGAPRSAPQWIAAGLAALIMLGLWPQPVVAIAFLVAAVLALRGGRLRRRTNALASLAAGVVGSALGLSWIASRIDPGTFRPVIGLRVYEVALIVAGALLGVGLSRVHRPGAMTDTLLSGGSATGLAGLERLLREVFADPDLTIVGEGDQAAVLSSSPLLQDDDSRRAVDEAVALAARHAALTDSLEKQRIDLEAASRRLVTSVDRRRAIVGRRLRREVLVPLAQSEQQLREARDRRSSTETIAAIDIALREVQAARRDVMGMVRGIPPVTLGGGRIRRALMLLAQSAGPAVTVEVDPRAQGDEATEIAVFYICSEALTNALRHSRASTIGIKLTVVGDSHLHLTVRDDGVGGAESYPGSGLEGLRDRVSTIGGELQITTGPDGTIVGARLPVTTPAATAAG